MLCKILRTFRKRGCCRNDEFIYWWCFFNDIATLKAIPKRLLMALYQCCQLWYEYFCNLKKANIQKWIHNNHVFTMITYSHAQVNSANSANFTHFNYQSWKTVGNTDWFYSLPAMTDANILELDDTCLSEMKDYCLFRRNEHIAAVPITCGNK